MKIFNTQYLDDLTGKAKVSPRLRQHRNIHQSYQDASQRLFNAIEPGSYIRPHRHVSDPREELLIAVRGVMAMVAFDDQGAVTNVLRFGTLIHQCSQAVIQPAETDTYFLSQFALSEVGVFLQDAHDPKMGVFLDLGLTACHGGSFKVVLKRAKCALGRLLQCRVAIGSAVLESAKLLSSDFC